MELYDHKRPEVIIDKFMKVMIVRNMMKIAKVIKDKKVKMVIKVTRFPKSWGACQCQWKLTITMQF